MLRFEPGEVLAVPTGPLGTIDHVGIYTESHTVVSSTRKDGVTEEHFSEFSGDRPVCSLGYPGEILYWQVIARARSMIGHPWNAILSNCEHFARWAHGLKPDSPQLTKWLLLGSAALIALAAWARSR